MTQQARNFLCGLLALWVLALVGLGFVVMKDLHAPASALLGLFQTITPTAPKTALISEKPREKTTPTVTDTVKTAPIASQEQEKTPEQTGTLLPIGHKAGKATLQRGTLEKTEAGYIFTVPYTGSIYNYTTYTIKSKRAQIFDIRGDIRCDYHVMNFKKPWDISMIQMAMHEGYARISVTGRTNITTYKQEIRYTPTALQIYLRPAAP